MLAALPIATELKTIYFSTGEATEATGSKGSRYSFRTGTDTYSIAAASMPWAVQNFGKAWTIIYADYAWGQSTDQESKAFIERAGGKVLKSIAVPLDTKDFVPYLAQVPADTEVVLPAFIGSLSVAFYTQAKNMGLDKKTKMISSSASIESIAPDDIQGAAEGVYFFENFPRMLKAKNDEFHKEFNKRLGIDDVDAREIGGQRVMDKSHGWQAWEDIFALKQAIEKSGYKTRKDVEGVIQALEGMEMKNSLAHPQGDKLIRKEDHVGIIDCYISRVEGGKFEVKKRIPKEELAKNMPLRHDLSKMPA
jgi:branched-chain amino acid transport system substrate-binding protein